MSIEERTAIAGYTDVKVFSATKFRDRSAMGASITEWIQQHPDIQILEKVVTQSSDNEFHCYTMTFFYKDKD